MRDVEALTHSNHIRKPCTSCRVLFGDDLISNDPTSLTDANAGCRLQYEC